MKITADGRNPPGIAAMNNKTEAIIANLFPEIIKYMPRRVRKIVTECGFEFAKVYVKGGDIAAIAAAAMRILSSIFSFLSSK